MLRNNFKINSIPNDCSKIINFLENNPAKYNFLEKKDMFFYDINLLKIHFDTRHSLKDRFCITCFDILDYNQIHLIYDRLSKKMHINYLVRSTDKTLITLYYNSNHRLEYYQSQIRKNNSYGYTKHGLQVHRNNKGNISTSVFYNGLNITRHVDDFNNFNQLSDENMKVAYTYLKLKN